MLKYLSIFFYVTVSIFNSCLSQEAVIARDINTGSCEKCDIIINSIIIANQANRKLIFNVKPEEGSVWNTFDLPSAENIEIGCNTCNNRVKSFDFSIKTTDKDEVNYSLPVRRRYVLFWNQRRSLWDLKLVE